MFGGLEILANNVLAWVEGHDHLCRLARLEGRTWLLGKPLIYISIAISVGVTLISTKLKLALLDVIFIALYPVGRVLGFRLNNL